MLNNLSLGYTIVLGIAVILFTGLAFGKIAKLIRVPNVTGYLLGGLLIGPVFLGLIFPGFQGIIGKDFVKGLEVMTAIELGFIAFSVGSEFKISYFKQVGAMPVIIAFAESLAAVLFITGGMLLFGLPAPFAIAMGAVGGATAPAATILVIKQYKARGDLAKTTMSVVAIDDASALIFFGIAIAIVKSLLNPSAAIGITLIKPFIEIFGSFIMGLVSGIALTVLVRFFKGRGTRTCLTIAFIFLNIGLCLLFKSIWKIGGTDHLEFSSLLACMAMGAIFTNFSPVVDEVAPLMERITPPFVIIFFVLAGADLELASISWPVFGALAIYLLFRIAGKVFGTWASGKACKAPAKIQKYLGMGLLPQGGIAIGLSLIVMQTFDAVRGTPVYESLGIYNGDMVRLIVIFAVFVSEIFGPILLKQALIKSGEAEIEEVKHPRKAKNREPKNN